MAERQAWKQRAGQEKSPARLLLIMLDY